MHHLITRDKNELIRKVYEAQESAPVKDDWVLQVKSDLHELNLHKDELYSFKKLRLKKELRKRILNASFKYLQNIKLSQSKLQNVTYKSLDTQKYLISSKFTDTEKFLLFRLRTRMIDVRENFKNKYLSGTPAGM